MDKKYLELLDEETLAFIKQTEEFYPADAIDASIGEQREYYNALCKTFDGDYPDGVSVLDNRIETDEHVIAIRDYTCDNCNPGAHVVFYHGGGFILGGLESHDSICAEICGRTGLSVTAVDYRLAPEHLHPAAFNDAQFAFQKISTRSGLPVILVGDSAGGNLAAAVSHAARGHTNAPIGQVLIYPGLGGDASKGSYLEHSHAPLLTTEDLKFYHRMRMQSGREEDATSMPLLDANFGSLPPTVIISAQCDPLADDGRVYRDHILETGGKAVWYNEPGLVHGYLRARFSVKRAEESFTRICNAIAMLAEEKFDFS